MQMQALALLLSGVGAQLVGPGGVVPYGGGGGGPRRVGTVRDWAQGFFVAGSTLDDLNGVYALVDPNTLRRACRTRRCKVAYRNEESDWILAFAGPPVGLKTKSGKETEWVFVDQSGKDRFEHAGDTVIPGAGDSWSHSHRPSPYERTAAEDMAAGDDDDDVNELPWQVIYIGDRNMVWNLVNQRRHHNAVIRNALAGNAVSEFGSLQALAAPDGATPESKREPVAPPADLVAKADASEAARFAANGDYGKCADAWKAGKYAIQPFWNRAEDAEIVKWASALASLRRGECCRRSRRFDEARTSLKEALELFPTYGAALVADAALALDAGRASDALRNAERLAWTDRTRDGVRDAVVFAAVDVERRRLAGGNESHNHYLVLGVTRDFGTDELRKAFGAVHKSKFHGAFTTGCAQVPRGVSSSSSGQERWVDGGLRARVGGARLPRRSGEARGVRPRRRPGPRLRAGRHDAGHALFRKGVEALLSRGL